MSVISITTPFNIDLEFNVAPIWKRGVAWLLDTLIQLLYFLCFVFVIIGGLSDFDTSDASQMIVFTVFCGLPLALYHFLSELFMGGQSLGKKALQIRVVNMMGNEASIGQYLIRLMFRSMSLIPLLAAILTDILGSEAVFGNLVLFLLAIGIFVLFVTSPKGQRLGDRLADTLVIEKRAEANIHKTIFRAVTNENYVPRYPEVMRLSDRDINGIRNLLNMKPGKDTDAYIDRIAYRVISILGLQSTEDSRMLLEHMLFDYNFLSRK